MPTYLSPGVYVEEVDSGSRPIEGVGTAVAAFVGLAEDGPFNTPTLVTNWTPVHRHLRRLRRRLLPRRSRCTATSRTAAATATSSGSATPPTGTAARTSPRDRRRARKGAWLGTYASWPRSTRQPEGGRHQRRGHRRGRRRPDEDMFKLVVKQAGRADVEEFDRLTTGPRARRTSPPRSTPRRTLIRIEETATGTRRSKRPTGDQRHPRTRRRRPPRVPSPRLVQRRLRRRRRRAHAASPAWRRSTRSPCSASRT